VQLDLYQTKNAVESAREKRKADQSRASVILGTQSILIALMMLQAMAVRAISVLITKSKLALMS